MQVSLWFSGGEPWVASGDSTFFSPHLTEMQNQEDYWEKLGRLPTKKKSSTSIFSPHNQAGARFAVFLVLQFIQFNCFIYCIHQRARLLILRGYLTATAWIWRDVTYGQVQLVDFCKNWEDLRLLHEQKWWEVAKQINIPFEVERFRGKGHPKLDTDVSLMQLVCIGNLLEKYVLVLFHDKTVVVHDYRNILVARRKRLLGFWKPAVPQLLESKT